MSKRYRPWKFDEPMLLPATVQEFVDKDHLARFVVNLVVEEIELEEIDLVTIGDGRAGGQLTSVHFGLGAPIRRRGVTDKTSTSLPRIDSYQAASLSL
jgi:hypothetical protein